jgi:hypothetical protein
MDENNYIIKKTEEVLCVYKGKIKYIMEDIENEGFDSSFRIDGREIIYLSEFNKEFIKNNPGRFRIFNPIKYDSHLELLIEKLTEFDENYSVYTFKDENDNLYYSSIMWNNYDYEEVAISNEYGYKKRNKSILVAILNILNDDFEEERCKDLEEIKND